MSHPEEHGDKTASHEQQDDDNDHITTCSIEENVN